MGLDNRDYVHDESGYDGFGGDRMPGAAGMSNIVKCMVVLTLTYFAALLLPDLAHHLTLTREGLFSGKLWQLLTYAMTPAGVAADNPARGVYVNAANSGVFWLLITLFITYQFGRMTVQFLGFREMLAMVAGCVFAGGLFAAAALPGQPYANVAVVAEILLVWVAMERPHDRIMLMFIIPAPMWVAAGITVLFLTFASVTGNFRAVLPVVVALSLAALHQHNRWRFSRLGDSFADWRSARSRPKLRVVRPEEPADDGLDARVDEVLAKLGEQGEASLTAKERKVLKQASKRYKGRV